MSRGPMHLGKAAFAGFLAWGSLACTLTGDHFDPEQVRAETLAASNTDPATSAPIAGDQGGNTDGAPECSNAEAPGCELPLITSDDECRSDLDCESRVCAAGTCSAPTCSDGRKNADEAAVDCGGGCPERCSAGDTCSGDQDCQVGYFCPPQVSQCTPAPCTDGACATPSCDDGAKNQEETDVDCGGGCGPCLVAQGCLIAADCQSTVCAGEGCGEASERCCQAPSCEDGVRNGTEPNIDCGDAACGLCPIGDACSADRECSSGLCQTGLCRPQPCADGVENGSETDVDCGGADPACRRCRHGDSCSANTDCASGLCTSGACVDCFDGIQNGNETGVDCGGACLRCPGEECDGDNGCASGVCEADLCCGGDGAHCTRCARFLADDLDCQSNGDAAQNDCEAFLQCLADNSDVCSVQSAPGCSDAACPYESFGGAAGPGVLLAATILIDARCDL